MVEADMNRNMTLFIGSDHAAFELKEKIRQFDTKTTRCCQFAQKIICMGEIVQICGFYLKAVIKV